MGKLNDKVAIVTGGAFGNGRGIAVRFAAEGADVVIADVDEARMAETAELIRAQGRRALVQRCDVSKKVDIDQLISAAVAQFGHVDIAVANAGVVEKDTDCLRMTEAQWDRTISVNLKGVFFTLQAAANQMIAQGRGGRLIATASVMAEWGSAGSPAYCASKGGVKQLVKSFAIACGRSGITCNAIGPGFIATGMTQNILDNPMMANALVDRTPVGRIGEPGDVANVAAFLAGDAAGFMTGTILFPDGGITAGMYSATAAQMAAQMAAQQSAGR
ncbi:MAG: SDR family oxidoreductase [Deltaproteobacteria bacterium]|nr:SDR family oxidoreductase [Deltaproteobacteria bacterium]MBI3386632.1 SDR family oxidoreductase [Deltaproteobacteria bacterium]